jgi:hypothetical protein
VVNISVFWGKILPLGDKKKGATTSTKDFIGKISPNSPYFKGKKG